ncbi:hypothetical protein HYQ44_002974 [Verticillium longisporum]|nr:hypothetical protein HYQ44_002974 [Verticillium longisporum]
MFLVCCLISFHSSGSHPRTKTAGRTWLGARTVSHGRGGNGLSDFPSGHLGAKFGTAFLWALKKTLRRTWTSI